MNCCYKRIKNFRLLIQILFSIFTLYLLYQELDLYIEIPVHTTKYKKPFNPDQFPDIFICHTPGFKLDKLEQHGYRGSFGFQQGRIGMGDELTWGWQGNKTNSSTEMIIRDISTISSVGDCPPVYMSAGMENLHSVVRRFHHESN